MPRWRIFKDVYIQRKNAGKQIDSRFLMDDVINKLGIVLETTNVSVDTYKGLITKVGNSIIEKIVNIIQQKEIDSKNFLFSKLFIKYKENNYKEYIKINKPQKIFIQELMRNLKDNRLKVIGVIENK
mgnify:CR=1 FL=1